MTNRLRTDANRCFVCGPGNPAGLHLDYSLDGDVCRAEFMPGPNHCGYDGIVHGGILYSVLDDAMANWLFLQDIRAHTARCEIRYRDPVPLGMLLRIEGRLSLRRRRLALMEAIALRPDGSTAAEATGSFMVTKG